MTITTAGTWYPPSLGTGGFLHEGQLFINPPFRTMSTDTITADDLALHAQWLSDSSTGKRLQRPSAYLTRANLTRAYLTGANLTGADLTGAYLTGANLTGANLTGADLTGAYLTRAYLTGANLTRANLTRAYLTGADLTGADLTGAYLTGAYLTGADLSGANLSGVIGLKIAADAPARLLAVARAALQPGALYMNDWHTCETTHCISGWAVHLAGEVGCVLETAVGVHMAGLYLLGVEAAGHFYDTNKEATKYLQSVIDAAGVEVGL
jgi:uncharacterized protein YjbI with pentapeptide repeats